MAINEVAAFLLLITALSSYVNYRFLHLPKSIGLTLITFFISVFMGFLKQFGLDIATPVIHALSSVEFSQTFIHGMLGFLLFAGALQINVSELKKHKTIIALLATVSVLISTMIIGLATWGIMQILSIKMSLPYCLLFGSLISPTDPVAVLGILKNIKAPKSLEMKIAGEALFNDGMGIVLFVALLGLTRGEFSTNPAFYIVYFLKQSLGGIAFGYLIGKVFSSIMRDCDSNFVLILLTLAAVTTGYTLADHYLQVSGVLTIAVCGLCIGTSLRQEEHLHQKRAHLYDFWEFLDEILNAILFVQIGLECLRILCPAMILVASVASIGVVVVARWISVAIPLGWISRFRFINSYVIWLMTWGGLRGGISIALALTIEPLGPERDVIIAITYSVVIFSIIVQGMTIAPLVSILTKKPSESSLASSRKA